VLNLEYSQTALKPSEEKTVY